MSSAPPRTRGFSIVELMVAVTLALIVTAAVMSAFLGSRSKANCLMWTECVRWRLRD